MSFRKFGTGEIVGNEETPVQTEEPVEHTSAKKECTHEGPCRCGNAEQDK